MDRNNLRNNDQLDCHHNLTKYTSRNCLSYSFKIKLNNIIQVWVDGWVGGLVGRWKEGWKERRGVSPAERSCCIKYNKVILHETEKYCMQIIFNLGPIKVCI